MYAVMHTVAYRRASSCAVVQSRSRALVVHVVVQLRGHALVQSRGRALVALFNDVALPIPAKQATPPRKGSLKSSAVPNTVCCLGTGTLRVRGLGPDLRPLSFQICGVVIKKHSDKAVVNDTTTARCWPPLFVVLEVVQVFPATLWVVLAADSELSGSAYGLHRLNFRLNASALLPSAEADARCPPLLRYRIQLFYHPLRLTRVVRRCLVPERATRSTDPTVKRCCDESGQQGLWWERQWQLG
ncbi:hypothetical protein FISHEDRAFT_78160 [Fistulina hepatica ATCC 64428]|nr:hypothetical protein FISHEDRAFT_78160 [Fistulina hepatica ATCC 64428]